ncbi:Uncharacterized protein FWK35_00015179 [Aphis craccivora]|uniref:Uncharacterized protein n=1 Tax=Aphis craccivora TaxID=307492 RepID=A0A6G0Z2L7_APHCR|nr:Uncharacterized protein FWK35_00015179 [Aphis craccivora]
MAIKIDLYNNNPFTLKMLLINNIDLVISELLKSANFSPSRNDGTPVNQFVSTRAWFDVYDTTGLGKTEYESKMDCVIQITQLMKENFSINSSSNSHKFQTNTNCFSDLPYAIYVAENSSMFSKEQTEKLGILGYFLDTGDTKLPLEMLYDISNIMITRPRKTVRFKNGMHVYKYFMFLYSSTGLGLTLEAAKMNSAEKMIYTLKKLCGFVPELKLPNVNNPENDRNDRVLWMCLPINDQYKIKLIKYFLETPGDVSDTVQLNEIASMTNVIVKYSDTGNKYKLGVACKFGPYMTVGEGSTKMASVFKARSAMLEKLKLECGFVQYPRTFIPLDCLHNTARENCEKDYSYGRHNISDRSFLGVYPSNGNTPSEPLYSGDAMRNPTDTISAPFTRARESIEIVVQEGVIVRGTFNPVIERDHNYNRRIRNLRSPSQENPN